MHLSKLEFLWVRDTKLYIFFGLSCLFVIFTSALNIYLPILAKDIVQLITTDYVAKTLLFLSLVYGGLWTFNQFSLTIREILMIPVSERLISRLSFSIMQHLHTLPYEYLANSQTGRLIGLLKKAQIALPNLLWGIVFFTIPPLIEVCGAVLVLIFHNHFLCGFLLLTTFGLFMCYTIISAKKSILFHQKSQVFDGDVNAKLTDSLINFETIKYFGNEDLECENYKKYLYKRETAEITSLITLEKVRLIQFFILGSGFLAIIFSTILDIIQQKMHLGDFVLINTYLIQFFTPLSFLAIVFRNILRGWTDLKLLLNIFDEKPLPRSVPHLQSLKECQGRIEFKKLNFKYNVNREVLKDLSFTINQGQKIGIVGPIGSGKSTIIKLLLKLCNPTNGTILIDGQELETIDINDLKKNIGIVPQHTSIFNESIAYNMAYGNPSATEEEIQKVAHSLSMDDFIRELPNGYKTILGQQGITLSGGQRQSIGIARLVLKKPQIVILDEVTSSLDAHSETIVLNQLDRLCKDKTAIMIAHKLRHVIHCDAIFVLKDGFIIEKGTHNSLIEQMGVYRTMWDEQSKN